MSVIDITRRLAERRAAARAALYEVIAKRAEHLTSQKERPVCTECGGPLTDEDLEEGTQLCSPECVDDHYPDYVD